ncbi:signal peptide peptidase SppA [Actinobacillus equuli]|uniref:signal peptide peptidase SppA n=1 Tax=Actinobacillus equuli TaxID=718 RepID=UPI00241853D5|nr:signal peptide peptidase SppA [Actinobacillus equuli]MDG4951675.1 signal peptide peptidase SppA [Actinobacillus equuli subsp. equuli]WGE50890.1 signal peptide peptidase SppA [Actinobacillus equuli subsp. haemolyticus]
MLKMLKGLYQIFRCIREFVLSLFFIIFVLICFALTTLLQQESKHQNQQPFFEKGALQLNLDGYLADNHDEYGDLHRLIQNELGNNEPIKISTFDVARSINKAMKDERITGLVLDLGYFQGGDIASLQFIGAQISYFKQSGKPVIAIGEQYSQAQYYLASFADKIYLNKAGFVDIHALSYSNIYFKALLDKIEAVPHIFRVGTYKSAVEPFIRDDMSPEAKQNAQTWLTSIWNNIRQDIARNRQIQPEQVLPDSQTYIEKYKALKGDDAQYALNQKLITEVTTPSQIQTALIQQFGEDKEGNYKHIDYFDYAHGLTDRFNVKAENKIAVINVEGQIVSGKSSQNSAGSDTIVKQLRKAREDKNVRGVILRVNSPGGSAMASEIIRQELEAIQLAGKPVVTSMGGMAASGGYWISATSDKIIASPTTITGSIGIFGLATSFEKTAKNLGVTEDGISLSPFASSSPLKTLPKEQAEVIQISIENGYDRFLELVSRGRNMSKPAVDKIAQGQVWSGEDALKHGLVDELGDFDTAYDVITELVNQQRKAKGEAAIEHFRAQWFIDSDDSLLSSFLKGSNLKLQLGSLLGLPVATQAQQSLELLQQFNDPKHAYLYCLSCGTIK